MNRKEAEDYIYASYLRAQAYWDLETPDRTRRHPELTYGEIRKRESLPATLITGSKGKGSVATMLAAVLSVFGRTGCMTSPHLERFNERFTVDGSEITDEEFTAAVEAVKPALDRIEAGLSPELCISPMGIQTLAALDWFAKEGAAYRVMECGKGAAYDDVNNVLHNRAVIGAIFPEHLRELGPTLADIAKDKAHVITEDVECAYTAAQEPEVLVILRQRAEECGVPLKEYGRDFAASEVISSEEGLRFRVRIGDLLIPEVRLHMCGAFQAENAALALAVALDEVGEAAFARCLPEILTALSNIKRPGRMEILSSDPFVLLDACIHERSALQLLPELERMKKARGVYLLCIPADKDYEGVARVIAPNAEHLILTDSGNPHYHFSEEQGMRLRELGIEAVWIPDCKAALREASECAASKVLPLICLGTTSFLPRVREYFRKGSEQNE